MSEPKHPTQPIVLDEDGVARFKCNQIVADLARGRLNSIAVAVSNGIYDNEDYVQLMELIGYSLTGFGELSMISDDDYERAEREGRSK